MSEGRFIEFASMQPNPAGPAHHQDKSVYFKCQSKVIVIAISNLDYDLTLGVLRRNIC